MVDYWASRQKYFKQRQKLHVLLLRHNNTFVLLRSNCKLFHQEHELSKRVQSAREAEWEKITQLEQAKLQVSNME